MENNEQYVQISLEQIIALANFCNSMPAEAVKQLPLICSNEQLDKPVTVNRQWLENAKEAVDNLKAQKEAEKNAKAL